MFSSVTACKRKEDPQTQPEHPPAPKKPRLVFTDLQRRTLQAIFKVASASDSGFRTQELCWLSPQLPKPPLCQPSAPTRDPYHGLASCGA
ncbi:hypothetical protein J437_LFUL016080 [Ladona fulva]|uniref:Uncharacterized protein n=1 Tax=Ladona fulva TaxID=123851 RepID=A0A8K0KMV5_LADFU|nr:hypothetical protein J437_LFUL016080 [Ladona fulva]